MKARYVALMDRAAGIAIHVLKFAYSSVKTKGLR